MNYNLLFIIIFILAISNAIIESYSNKSNNIPDVKFPFKNLKDQDGKNLNMFILTAPFRSDKDKRLFNYYSKKYDVPFLGVTSYLNFPGEITHPYDDPYYKKHFKKHDYINSCIGWCHGVRDPKQIGLDKNKKPLLFFSESDIVTQDHKPIRKKKYDFLYSCLKDNDKCTYGWQAENRNWKLAKKCLPIMCEKFGLKGCLVGRLNCDYTPKCKDSLTILGNPDNEGKLEYNQFMKTMAQCKFLFLPNIRDASPRVLTEALVLDVPVLVNKNIYGGWKYVNESTGEFFNDEHDFPDVLDKMLRKIKNKEYKPREWFTKNYGPKKTGKKLKRFIKKIYPDLWDCNWVYFTK